MTAGDARRSRLADERAEWPARPSIAESPALGVNGANFVRIAPSWLSRDGGVAQTDLPRNRGLPGEKPPPSTISPMKSRSSRPRMFAPEDVLGAADAYGASGADIRELGKTQPRASQLPTRVASRFCAVWRCALVLSAVTGGAQCDEHPVRARSQCTPDRG